MEFNETERNEMKQNEMIFISKSVDFYFAKCRFSFCKVQMFHFAKYTFFPFRKVQISHFAKYRFFHFAKYRFSHFAKYRFPISFHFILFHFLFFSFISQSTVSLCNQAACYLCVYYNSWHLRCDYK